MRTGGRDAGAWIPAFAGMTRGWGDGVGVALCDTRFAGMTRWGAGVTRWELWSFRDVRFGGEGCGFFGLVLLGTPLSWGGFRSGCSWVSGGNASLPVPFGTYIPMYTASLPT